MDIRERVLNYQELTTNAWPPKSVMLLNGWVVRISEGVTKRANSVLPLHYHGEKLLDDIRNVEILYEEKKLSPIFQIPDYFEPIDLISTLRERNYKKIDETIVMTTKLHEIKHIKINNDYDYYIDNSPAETWFQAFGDITSHNEETLEGQKAIIGRIQLKTTAFGVASDGEEIIGIALAVAERGYVGIFDLIVDERYRRQGIAQSLITHIIDWGKKNSATWGYLQVVEENTTAISLYQKLGFKKAYNYRYYLK